MWRLIALACLILSVLSVPAFADDKKEPALGSLADEAAKLAEKSGPDSFWRTGEVTVKTGGLIHIAKKGKLVMRFSVEKGKATGWAVVEIDLGRWHVASPASRERNFELVEKDGKRFMNITLKDKVNTLEYSIRGTELIVKGGAISGWAGYDVDLSQATSFKPGTRIDDLEREVKQLHARVEELQRKLSEPELKNLQGTWNVLALDGDTRPSD